MTAAIITGVSKFSKVSLFSGLNNLRDITVTPEYSALCGYTDQDIDSTFAPELAGPEWQEIRSWYNGYSWLGQSGIAHQWFDNNPIARYEGYYASVFYAYFVAAGLDVRVEDATNLGRIDMTVRLGARIYLFEFKVVDSAAGGKALQQIKEKRYADKYRAEGMAVYMIGVEFSRSERNVVAFEVELA